MRFKFLSSLELLNKLTRAKIQDLNEIAYEITIPKKKRIFNVLDQCTSLYIVKQGVVALDTCIEVASLIKYPVKSDEWKLRQKLTKLNYKLGLVHAGGVFG
jgi:hypothetical protein